MPPQRLALVLTVVAVACAVLGFATGWREAGIVVGLFFAFLAGGVLNWDRRGGH
jgi:hypothetical protein